MRAPASTLAVLREASQRRARLIRHCRAVHRLGERVTFELVDEIARTLDAETVAALAEKFAGIDPDLLRSVGGDVFPAEPLRVVGGLT
jgi:hypothetical protein